MQRVYATSQNADGMGDHPRDAQLKKKRTVAATFLKGLRPEIRQLVLPHNPLYFNEAITMAPTQELNNSLLPSPAITQSASAVQTAPVDSIQQLQNRDASLELDASHQLPQGGSTDRPPFRRNFRQRVNFFPAVVVGTRSHLVLTRDIAIHGMTFARIPLTSLGISPRILSAVAPVATHTHSTNRDRNRHSSRSYSRDRRDHSSRSNSLGRRDHSTR